MSSDAKNSLWRASCVESIEPVHLDKSLSVDLLIIGGGFTGCSAALEASTNGASVCLLEANDIGYGGSGRNVGLVNAGLWLPPEEIIEQMGEASAKLLIDNLSEAPDKVFELINKHAIDCEAIRNGTLHCAHSKTGLNNLRERYRQGALISAPYKLLDASETQRRTGSKLFHGSLFDPRAGTIQPLAYCRGLARIAQEKGALIYQRSPVSSISRLNDSWKIKGNGHTVTAKSLLLATNAYHLGITMPFQPKFVKIGYFQCATAPLSEIEREDILPGLEGCWDTALVMSSFRLDQAGRLIVGGIGRLDKPGAPIHKRWARKKVRELFPQIKEVCIEHDWFGQIAMTSDHIPKIVQFGPNAITPFGYSGRGIGPGTVFGTASAQALISGDSSKLPILPVDIHNEYFTGLRETYYEFGATAVHATNINI